MWRNMVYLGAALLLFVASAHCQEAPGDEDKRCTSQIQSYPPNMKMLMNSRHYTELLGDGGVWDQIDFDDNNPPSFNPTFFKHNAGGICRWSVMSCGYRLGWQDNWLFTQFISKTVPDNTTHTVRIIVDILYTLSSCRARFNCNADFRLYKFETDGPQPREVYTDVSNYELVRSKLGYSSLTQSLVESIEVPPNVGGLYLAVRDNRSCIQVAQMKVYRHQCARKQEGLVVFPDTAAPVDTNMTVIAECMPNSSPAMNMAMTCDLEGNWQGTSRCVCDAGYRRQISGSYHNCPACPAGSYRSATDQESTCRHCPANTVMNKEAAPACECLAGYFRNTEGVNNKCPATQQFEDVSYGCTKPPSMPLNLRKTRSTDSSLSVSWNHPSSDGERNDLYYRVQYSDPDRVGVMIEAECVSGCLTGTSCTVSGLRPATRYVVRVSAHNGVSDQDEGGALARMKEVTLETDAAPPSAPASAQAFCQNVVWERPEFSNGDILRYLIKFRQNGVEITRQVPGDSNFFILPDNLPSRTVIMIFAVNIAGTGPSISATLPGDCGQEPLGNCPPCDCDDCPTPSSTECPTVPVPTTTVVVTRPAVTSTTTVTRVSATTVTTTSTTTRVVPTTVTTTVTSTATRTTSTPCPTPPPTTTGPITAPDAVVDITVMGQCTVAWRPPANTGGERPGYAIRFFDGATYEDSSYKKISRHFDDPDKMFITLPDCPSDRAIYADIRARNSAGNSPYSTAIQISDPETSPTSCPTCNSCCATCPTPDPCPVCAPPTICATCPPPETCPTCPPTPAPTTCPTATCPTCPEPTQCPPTECSTDPVTTPTKPDTSAPTLPLCSSSDRIRPSDITGVVKVGCGRIEWEPATVAGCTDPGLTYKIRIFSGLDFLSSGSSQRRVLSSNTNFLTFTSAEIPSTRPLKAIVKARRGNGVFSASWSATITLSEC